MSTTSDILRSVRADSGLSQRDLAALGGTSAATVAMYETGKKEPRISTLQRLVGAMGADLVIEVKPRLTVNERRSLELGRVVAERFAADPQRSRGLARRNLARWRRQRPGSRTEGYWAEWERILDGPDEGVIEILTSTSQSARDLRQASPFAGLLSDKERMAAFTRANT